MNTPNHNKVYDDETKYIITTLEDCIQKGHLYYIHSRPVISYVINKLEENGFYVKKNEFVTYICRKESKKEAFKQLSPYNYK
jgi:hypothetical protein